MNKAIQDAVDQALGEPLLHTPEEAASRLRISRAKLYPMLKDGTIRSVVIGRSRRISPAALEEYVQGLSDDAA